MKKVLAALALLVAAAWLFLRDDAPEHAPLEGSAPAVHVPAESSLALTGEGIVAPSEPASLRATLEPEVLAPHATSVARAAPGGGARILGRLVREDGAPAAGARLALRGWAANAERQRQHGLPRDWQDPEGSTDAEGRFEIRLAPPQAFQFTLETEYAGHAAASWRWSEILPDETKDLGEVVLRATGAVRARIVDAAGRVLVPDWTVYAEEMLAERGPSGRRGTRSIARPDPATGWALCQGLPPGRVGLSANSRIANWIDGPVVEVRAGEVVEAEIRYTGPDNTRRIVVVPFSRPFHTFQPSQEDIVLVGPAGEVRAARKIERSSQSYAFDDLDAGAYTVEVRDPRFLPWRRDGVEPGTRVDAHLTGSAAVRLEVVDAASGEPVPRHAVDVRFDGSNWSPNRFRIREPDAEAPAGGLYPGLVPHDLTVIVLADGYAPTEVTARALAPGETRALEARLTRGATVGGVVRTRGTLAPVVGADVALRPETERGMLRSRDDETTRRGRTGADGRFVFAGVPDGAFAVEASIAPTLRAQVSLVVAGGAPADLTIELAPGATLAGRVLGPAGVNLEGLAVVVQPVADPAEMLDMRWRSDRTAVPLAADGSFRTGLVPAGEVDVALRLPDARMPSGRGGWSSTGGGRLPLGRVTLVPGANERDFEPAEGFPGPLRVVARKNGASAPGLVVQAVAQATGGRGAVVLDDAGCGTLPWLAPGTYRLHAQEPEEDWAFEDPRVFAVAGPVGLDVALEIEVSDGEIELVDAATGAPAKQAWVQVAAAGSAFGGSVRRADDAGRLVLRLAHGRYELGIGQRPPYRRGPTFDWDARGAVPARLVLEAP